MQKSQKPFLAKEMLILREETTQGGVKSQSNQSHWIEKGISSPIK